MSDKYIIRNCPAYCYLGKECHNEESQYGVSCCEVTNCVMKRIVELCEQYKKDYNTTNGVWLLANNITNLLDIQEVE